MQDDFEKHDESEPDNVGQLLEEAFDGTRPSPVFVEMMSKRLDVAFGALVAKAPNVQPLADDRQHLRNGHAAAQPVRPLAVDASRRRRHRVLASFALAASLLVAFFVWSGRPSYSWASMIAALENKPWVEALGQRGGMIQVRGWVSLLHRVTAVRSEDEAVFLDMANGIRNTFSDQQQVVVQQSLKSDESPTMESALLGLLLAVEDAENRKAGNGENDDLVEGVEPKPAEAFRQPVRVLDESWQRVTGPRGTQIELDVVLELGEQGEQEPNSLTFILDPRTHLPMTCRLVRETDAQQVDVDFAFPADGPRDVRAKVLGIPNDAPLVEFAQFVDGKATREVDDSSTQAVPRPDEQVGVGEEQSLAIAESTESEPAEEWDDTRIGNVPVEPLASQVTESEPDKKVELPPPRPIDEMSRRVDELLAACWQENGIRPTSNSTDAEYLRRLYLDLTGRIPTYHEASDFLADGPPDRRELLLEELLARYDHASHLAAVWRRFLLPDGVDLTAYGGPVDFERWLTDRFRENVPYDEVVRELLLAEGRVNEAGPLMFYTALKLQPEQIAGQTSRAFLGTRMECAQCHDHFFDTRWTQEDFWAYAAFFAQISRPEGKFEMVSPVMRIQDSSRGEVMLPDSEVVVSPRFPEGDSSADLAGSPSRRRRLVAWLIAPNNPHFARATVNRVWEHLFGKGLVDPVDDMRPDNDPVCPEVLDELAEYFVRTGYDMRRLLQTIALTQAYQLSSGSAQDDPSRAIYFAQMNVKAFTAEQLFDSIAVATLLQSLVTEDGDANSVRRFNNVSRQEFLEQFRAPPGQMTEYHAGIPQALTLMNGRLIESATDLSRSGILRSLEMPLLTDEQQLENLFLATLARFPGKEEHDVMFNYLSTATNDVERRQALSDILWALLNTAEFSMNH